MMKTFAKVSHSGKAALSLAAIEQTPKIELHAHLSCSMTRKSFAKLMAIKDKHADLSFVDQTSDNEVFFREVFPKLVAAIEGKKDLKFVTSEVLASFEDDGVRYAEFRSTPKKLNDNTSIFGYVENILEVMDQWKGTESSTQMKREPMESRFILSLNRSRPQEHFFDVIKQVKRDPKWAQYITGVDFSGDPYQRDVNDYRKCFEMAREAGLKLTIHTAELPFHSVETPGILALNPERLGHFIYYTEEEFQLVKEKGIHIEACPTSNFVTSPTISPNAHPINEMYTRELSLSVCTDDQLIFNKTLSEEIKTVTDAFGYDMEFVEKICRNALQAAFINDSRLKSRLGHEIDTYFAKSK